MNYSFDGINTALQGLSREVLSNGIERKTRGFTCYELPTPVLIEIQNPQYRYCSIKERKWNVFLPHMESLWLASGRNDMEMAGHYVKKLYEYSDDGKFMRAGYGPRLRYYNGKQEQYQIGITGNSEGQYVDQFSFVIETLLRDINSRQACITIHDPMKDDFDSTGELLVTKDQPCTRMLQFMVRDGKLDLTVYMRSNDLIFGFSAVNLFNFTFMQEYFSYILGLPIGKYYHFVNNLHIYDWSLDMVKSIAEAEDAKEFEFKYKPPVSLDSLDSFDKEIYLLEELEHFLRKSGEFVYDPVMSCELFQDWKYVFVKKNTNEKNIKFINPFLEERT